MGDKDVKSGKAKKKLFRYAQLHPTGISQKVIVIVEHFRERVMHLLGGQAKAMVVTDSRVPARTHTAVCPLIFREMLFRPTEPLLNSARRLFSTA